MWQLGEAADAKLLQDAGKPASCREVELAMALALFESCESIVQQTPLNDGDPSFWSDARADAHAASLWFQALLRLHIRGHGEP